MKASEIQLRLFAGAIAIFTTSAAATEPAALDQRPTWRPIEVVPQPVAGQRLTVRATKFRAFALDRRAMAAELQATPMEAVAGLPQAGKILELPMPDGSLAGFEVFESPVMEPPLAAKYPEIRTYVGWGLDDPAASLRCDLTPHGFHAQILSPRGAVYIDPYQIGDDVVHASYFKRDATGRDERFECLTPADDAAVAAAIANAAAVASDGKLRTYRLANAATGEYTQFHGGTVAAGLAAVVTAINRVTGVYEIDLGVRLVLVANNDQLIYTNGATDPYSNGDVVAMLSQNQSNITAVIGTANYDVGHVFGTGGGGVAGLRVVCGSTSKARGVTALNSPTGDAFYIDYVAHEMGHQFGANHSFNGTRSSCGGGNRNGSTAYEPGSGSTIMAYAGICGADNLQAHSDPYFHFISIQEIATNITSQSGSTCPVQSTIGGAAPTVDAGPDYVIPAGTPFELTAAADDADGDAITYCWEQRDLGPGATLGAPDDGLIPLFRSFNPTEQPTRTFPRLSDLLNNTSSQAEKLPVLDRAMDFRVTVRDNLAGGGQTDSDDMVVTVEGSAGPFQVTFPNTAVSVSGGLTVTWNVANTDAPPVSATDVDILLSTDGGLTFPTVLAAAVPNDGSHTVALPDIFTNTARTKVQGAGNIFFDLSNSNFTINACVEIQPAQPEPQPVAKNRYLSFVPGNPGVMTAVRVKLVDLPPPFDAFNGQVRWLAPPSTLLDTTPPNQSLTIAPLGCEPHYLDWGAFDVVHAYGADIVPGSDYDVQLVQCDPGEEANFTAPLPITTARWGDVAAPFNPPATGQPDALDVSALVSKFKSLAGSPRIPQADLQPNVPDRILNALDIALCVEAFKGTAYPFAGPQSCPP